ncbi:MAG: autotransporter-associated beta strand repeat-containing protein [Enterobacteriaceae bacterium]
MMNKIYRVIWSEALHTRIAVSEIYHAAGKKKHGIIGAENRLWGRVSQWRLKQLAAALLLAFVSRYSLAAPAPQELPTGAQVTAGQATISQSAATMTIQQSSSNAVVNWNSFNVGSQAQVNIYQPNSSSALLNRVTGGSPSQIFGQIHANGQVYLVNSQGVYIAPGASVQSGSFVASTMGISDQDFMSGKRTFNRNSSTASVVNEGTITAVDSGFVALLAPEVRNEGLIVANMGTVAMAGGESVELQFNGANQLVNLIVDPATIKTEIDNHHAVLASGGQIILSARSVSKLEASVINNDGQLDASSLKSEGGHIVLEADDITVGNGSVIAADGATGGGTVHIGGDWQGQGSTYEATQVTVDQGAVVSASATQQGNGGEVVIRSNVSNNQSWVLVDGKVSAQGAGGGAGGKVETSGYQFGVGDKINPGSGGLWLLDPANITIAPSTSIIIFLPSGLSTTVHPVSGGTIDPQTIVNLLNNNTDVDLNATRLSGSETGTITINSAISISPSGGATLYMDAGSGGISINAPISASSGTLSLYLNSQGGISSSSAGTINTNGGSLTLNSASSGFLNGAISGSGSVQKTGSGILNLSAANNYSGGTTIYQGSLVILTGALGSGAIGSGDITLAGGNLQFDTGAASNSFILTNNFNVTANSGFAADTANLALNGNISLGQGDTLTLGNTRWAGDHITINGNITGSGNLNIQADGLSFDGIPLNTPTTPFSTVTSTGNNSFSGNLTVSVGEYDISANNSCMASVSVSANTIFNVTGNGNLGNTPVINNGQLLFSLTNNETFSGIISGNGTVTQQGNGTVTLTANNSYSGTTTINSNSSLQFGNGGSTGTLGSGAVVDNGNLSFDLDVNFSVPNLISGTGNLTQGGTEAALTLSTMTLLGNNTYSGMTTVMAGRALQVGNGGSDGSLGLGNVVNNNLLLFNINIPLNYQQVISGTGEVIQNGSGVLTLMNNNTYTGRTSAGIDSTLQIVGTLQSNLLTSSGVVNFNIANNMVFNGAVAGFGNGTFAKYGLGTLTINGNMDFSCSSTSDCFNVYQGMLVLAGNNTFNAASMMNVTQGAIQFGTGRSNTVSINGLGNIVSAGNVIFNLGDNETYNGTLSGAGSLVKSGNGTLTLNQNNSYSGSTQINAGTLALNVGAAGNSTLGSGNVILAGGNLQFNAGNATANVNYNIAVQANSGLILDPGLLHLNDPITLSNGSMLVFSTIGLSTDNIEVDGVISGNGSITQAGPGTLTLLGNNNYSGTTTINANATLQVGNCSNSGQLGLGNVFNNGTLIFQLSTASGYQYGGIISGPGSVEYQACSQCTGNGANGSASPPVSVNSTLAVLYHSMSLDIPSVERMAETLRVPILQQDTVSHAMQAGETVVIKFINELHQIDAALVLVPGGMSKGGYRFRLYDAQQLAKLKGKQALEVTLPPGDNTTTMSWLRLLESQSGEFEALGQPDSGLPAQLAVQINGRRTPMMIDSWH